jgi:hypothetical protein
MKLLILAAVVTIPTPASTPTHQIIVDSERPSIVAPVIQSEPPRYDYNESKFDLKPDFQGFMRVIPPSSAAPTQILPNQSYSLEQLGQSYDSELKQEDFSFKPVIVEPKKGKQK